MCMSYENVCENMLDRIGCFSPPHRENRGCELSGGVSSYVGRCGCGGFDVGDIHVGELLIDTLLARRYDLAAYGGSPALVDGGVRSTSAGLTTMSAAAFSTTCSAPRRAARCKAARTRVTTTPGQAPARAAPSTGWRRTSSTPSSSRAGPPCWTSSRRPRSLGGTGGGRQRSRRRSTSAPPTGNSAPSG